MWIDQWSIREILIDAKFEKIGLIMFGSLALKIFDWVAHLEYKILILKGGNMSSNWMEEEKQAREEAEEEEKGGCHGNCLEKKVIK